MRFAIAVILALLLTACPGQVRPTLPAMPTLVRVPVTTYVPVPAELTEPCPVYEAKEQTYQEAKDLALKRRESLIQCNKDKARIRALKSSPEPAP